MGNDISIFRAGAALGAGAIGTVVGAVGIGGASLIRTPEAVATSYKALWDTPKIGPNLKTALGVAGLPIAAVLADTVAPVAGAGYGLFRGFTGALKKDSGGDGFVGGITKTMDDVVRYYDQAPSFLNDAYGSITQPLAEGEKPYDVKIFEAAKGIVAGVGTAPLMALGIGALTLLHTPKAFGKLWNAIWEGGNEAPILATTLSGALILATPIADVLAPVAGLFYGFGRGVQKGYTTGMKDAFVTSWNDIKNYNKLARDMLTK